MSPTASAIAGPLLRAAGVAGLIAFGAASPVRAGPATLPSGFTDTRLAGFLDHPVALALLPGPGEVPRILFAEQSSARIGLLVGANVTTAGTVPDVETAGYESGLLGIAVDPNFPGSPYLYVHATDSRAGGRVAISRFTLSGDLDHGGPGTVTFEAGGRYDVLVDLPDDASFHNGGTVRFGPDGMLYVSLGDDGDACDAQRIDVPAGKILRLDVSGVPAGAGGPAPWALLTPPDNPHASSADSSARLVWTSGLRNPFRFHVDALTGDLFVADVGENSWEELTRFAAGGRNGGWPWYEGPDPFVSCGGAPPSFTDPIAVYDHGEGAAIVSAGVYRRPPDGLGRFPAEYDGNAFYIDFYSGFMRRLAGAGESWSTPAPVPGQPNATDWATGMTSVADLLMLPDGSLAYVRQSVGWAAGSGEIRRIAYAQTVDVAPAAPMVLELAPPRPTPSRGAVTLAWSQPVDGNVQLEVLDVQGRVVRSLEQRAPLPAGRHERVWDGRGSGGAAVAPGLYFVRLEVGGDARVVRTTRLR